MDFATMTQAHNFRYLCVRNSWVDRDVMLIIEGKGSRDITGESSTLFFLMEYSKLQVEMAIMKAATRPFAFAQVISCILLPSNIFILPNFFLACSQIGGHLNLVTHALLCSITHKLGTPYNGLLFNNELEHTWIVSMLTSLNYSW
jgi:hypothetical protein